MMITFFLPTILISALACGVLSLYGSVVVARQRATNLLFYSEMSKIGMILGLFISSLRDSHSSLYPFLGSLLFAMIFYFVSEKINTKIAVNKESFFLALFVVAIQVEQLFSHFLGGIEKHELGQFYGDVVTIASHHLFWLAFSAVLFFVIFILYEKTWFVESFNQMILRKNEINATSYILYHGSVVILSTICVLFLGLWLTLVCVLVPPIFLSKLPFKKRKHYYMTLFFVVAMSCVAGFLLGLSIENAPTTPLIICTISIVTVLVKLTEAFLLWDKKRKIFPQIYADELEDADFRR